MGYASANLLLVARSADLFGASVVMKETHEGIQADVELYHKLGDSVRGAAIRRLCSYY